MTRRTRKSEEKQDEGGRKEDEEEERWRVAWMSDDDFREGVARGIVAWRSGSKKWEVRGDEKLGVAVRSMK